MKSYKQAKGVRNIKTALTGDKRGNEQRIVNMRRLVNLETQRNRLSMELQKCLQKQHQLREQIEDIISEVEEIQDELGQEVTFQEDKGILGTRLEAKKTASSKAKNKKKFVIEY